MSSINGLSPVEAYREYPIRGTTLVAMVVLIATAAILVGTFPAAKEFLNSTYGYVVLGGSAVLTLGLLAWIFKPAYTQTTIAPNEVQPEDLGDEDDLDISTVHEEFIRHAESGVKYEPIQVAAAVVLPQAEPYTQNADRVFHTVKVEDLAKEPVGSYAVVGNGRYQLLVVRDLGKKRAVYIRESTTQPGLYRMVMNHNGKQQESLFCFSKAQIASMIRFAAKPHPLRISGVTQLISATGLIVFAGVQEGYYIVNREGFLAEISRDDLLALMRPFQRR